MHTNFWGWKKQTNPFSTFLWVKLVPLLQKTISVKALKCKNIEIITCLIKLLFKNSIQTICQGGTSWVAQILKYKYIYNYIYIYTCLDSTLFCTPTFEVQKKRKNQLKINWNQLEINWNQLETENQMKSIGNHFESQLKSIENQLKVNWNQLKISWH